MKKMLMLIPFLLSICFMFAQVNEYTFVQSNQTYTEITGGTVVITGNVDDTQYAVAPPFAFTFNSTAVTAMAMSSNGYISFNAGTTSFGYTAISSTAIGTGAAAPMSRDLRGRPDGEMRWEVLGTAPNRTAVYQWKNWTAYGTGYVDDNWNFQVILYETTNDIAFRYGPFTFVSTYINTAQVGLRGETNAAFINRTTTDNWNTTTPGTTNAATCAITSTIYPANGLQFRYNYPIASLPPNPAIAVSPLDGAIGVMTSATLNWASGGGLPTGYRLNFGTNTPPTNIVNNMDLGAVNTYTPTPPMNMNTTYYWQIIPYNGFGNAANCPIWSFTTGGAVVLMSNGTQAVPDGVTYSFFDSGGPDGTYQNSENYTFTFTAATPSSTLEIAFSFFSLESGWDYLRIYDGPDANAPQIGPIDGYTGTTSPGSFEVGNAVTFVFTSDTSVMFDGWAATVTAIGSVPNDLQAYSITGPTGPAVGTPADYTITVRNRGTLDQSTYTVQLMSGTTVLASVPGPAILSGAEIPVVISYTFTAQGPITIFGRVVLTGDQVPANNDTEPLNVVVQASGTYLVEIGTGTTTQRQPFGIYYGYERDASLYTAAEIGAYGALTALKWYVGTANPYVVPYKIYLKSTTDATLTNAPWATMIADATLMMDATYSFSQVGWVTFNFPTPFAFTSGNLMVLVETNVGDWQSSYATFRYSNAPAGHHLYWYQDGSAPTGNGTANANRPNIGIFLATAGLGHVSGTVTSGTTPLEGAIITVAGAANTTTTNASGYYSLQYIPQGPQNITASKIGYAAQTLPVTIVENETATLNFNLVALPQVTVTGLVVGSDAPTVGLADASVTLTGMVDYTATTNATGQFTIPNVYASQTYNYTVTKAGYTNATGTVTIGTTNFNMGTITLNEIAIPATGVEAVLAAPNVNLTWMAPGTGGGEWIQYDSGTNNDSIGLTAGGTFDIASRWPAASLTDYVGQSLFAIRYWPGDTATYSMRVWTGGSQTAPGQLVYDQPLTNYTVDAFNTYILDTPVPIAAGQELWFGFNVTHAAGAYPAGCDAGPAHNGLGNMIYNAGAWSTLYDLAPTLNYDWNLAGYVGYSAPTAAPIRLAPLAALPLDEISFNDGQFSASGRTVISRSRMSMDTPFPTRSLEGYKVWRLLEGQESNEAAWTLLTANTISATAYQDMGWATVPDGNYKWAVKAVYSNNVLSVPALSNMLQKITQIGTIAGLVRNTSNQPIAGATVAAGTYTATTNTTGAYSLQVPAGTYTVTCTAAGYNTGTQTGIVVVTGQTTSVNFILTVANLVTDGFETYSDFALDFPPWVNVDVDQSTTYTITGVTFPGGGDAMAYIVFNPSATTPPLTTPAWTAHGGAKYAACFAATTPANNDWLISQLFENVGENASVGFWAKSVTAQYGLERFKVGVSTGGTAPANFTFISGASYVTAPVDWTWFEYDIPATYVGGNLRVGIQCVSNDAFVFMLDDFVMDLGTVSNVDPVTPVVMTALSGNFPNPFNPETTISYSVKGTAPVTVEIYNAKGQKVKTLVNETKAEGHYQAKWDGRDDNNQAVTSGVYFYKMNAGKYTSTKKMILMK